LDLVWPLNFSATTVAEFAVKEDFSFAIFAEESFLLLQFLGHGDTVGPRFGATPWRFDMLLYAAVGSISVILNHVLSQHHCKNPIWATEAAVQSIEALLCEVYDTVTSIEL